jgi:hypothetical protein
MRRNGDAATGSAGPELEELGSEAAAVMDDSRRPVREAESAAEEAAVTIQHDFRFDRETLTFSSGFVHRSTVVVGI